MLVNVNVVLIVVKVLRWMLNWWRLESVKWKLIKVEEKLKNILCFRVWFLRYYIWVWVYVIFECLFIIVKLGVIKFIKFWWWIVVSLCVEFCFNIIGFCIFWKYCLMWVVFIDWNKYKLYVMFLLERVK